MQSETQTGYNTNAKGIEIPIKEKETKYSKSGAKKIALELYENGKTPAEITRELLKEGYEVTEEGIRYMLIKDSKVRKNVVSDIQVAKKFREMIIDYDKELKGIMTEIKEARNMAKESRELSAWSALLGRTMQAVELFSKIAGDYKDSKIDVNIIFNEIDDRLRASKGIFEEPIDIDSLVLEEDEIIAKRKDNKGE